MGSARLPLLVKSQEKSFPHRRLSDRPLLEKGGCGGEGTEDLGLFVLGCLAGQGQGSRTDVSGL